MGFKKPNEELEVLLDDITGELPTEKKMMFGCPAYFAGGKMFAGVFEDGIFLRFNEQDRIMLLENDDELSHFDPLGGKPMREYLSFPEPYITDIAALEDLVHKAWSYAMSIK